MLGFFANAPEELRVTLFTSVDQMLRAFPVRSDEYEAGSAKRREYLTALDKVLGALVASSSLDLLKRVVDLVVRERKAHIHFPAIQTALAKFIAAPTTAVAETLNRCFTGYSQEQLPAERRRNAVARVIVPLLRSAPVVRWAIKLGG